MSWKGTGRSGYGDQAILGDYDDWDGLSMNGRQWKSRETKETRDLSGADYWHQRKALEPKTIEDIPTYVNGRPNIQAFAEPTSKPKTPAKPKLTAFDKVCTADRTYSRLCALSEELDNQLENGELDLTDWSFARKQLDVKLDKSWKAVCRLRNWNESGESLDSSLDDGLTFSLEDVQSQQIVEKNKRKTHVHTGWVLVDGLSEENVFRGLFCKVKKVMMFIERIKQQL